METCACAVELVMAEISGGADGFLVAQSQETAPAERVRVCEVDAGTVGHIAAGQLTTDQ